MSNWRIRLAGSVYLVCAAWYAPWMLMSMNRAALWEGIPFVAANLLILVSLTVAFINNWARSVPEWGLVPRGSEPVVIVLIATCGEPIAMVTRTVHSILEQDWPAHCLRIVVGDDGHSQECAAAVAQLRRDNPAATIAYFTPPPKGSPQRHGEAKAGNMNASMAFALRLWPDAQYIETRDADDEVGSPVFMRECIGQLLSDPKVAFVQTIKEARVSRGDPFGNQERFFYCAAMLGRNAANAVFPCGSGLVWKREALQAIGGFPTWNLVEDLQSGIEALRMGWRGIYLPIVGAIAQHAPEDIPNLYKQRGVWALDTMRLMFWGKWHGLNLRQRLHFWETGLFYVQSLTTLVIIGTLIVSYIIGQFPLATDALSYVVHFWPLAISIELFAAALNWPQPYEAWLRSREMWTGLTLVYAKAVLLALLYGPRRKPAYRVTRKSTVVRWYWRETFGQFGLIVLLLGAMIYGFIAHPSLAAFNLGSSYWVIFYVVFLVGFVRKGWYGVRRRARSAMPPAKTTVMAGAQVDGG
ncbi:MAG TPA: glycosyltransferase [Ktedonobacterales bacterium]